MQNKNAFYGEDGTAIHFNTDDLNSVEDTFSKTAKVKQRGTKPPLYNSGANSVKAADNRAVNLASTMINKNPKIIQKFSQSLLMSDKNLWKKKINGAKTKRKKKGEQEAPANNAEIKDKARKKLNAMSQLRKAKTIVSDNIESRDEELDAETDRQATGNIDTSH